MSGELREAVSADRVVVAIDPGKAASRVWVSTGLDGLVAAPRSVPTSRAGAEEIVARVTAAGGSGVPVVALEQTGSLHRPWQRELERRWPGSLRLFAPSETEAARCQLGSRRVKTDDRDCAALTWLARQGAGRPALDRDAIEALAATVRHRRGQVAARRALRQQLHDQLNGLCPGLSAPAGHGRALALHTPTGVAVLACAAAFAGRPPTLRSLQARAPGRLTDQTARLWIEQWKRLLRPPLDAELRAERLGRDLQRLLALGADIAAAELVLCRQLADTDGQVLCSLPGVSVIRAATFAAFTLPVERFATAEALYAATGLAPASYESSTIRRRSGIRRTGLPEHRDALMGIAWGLPQSSPAFCQRDRVLRAPGCARSRRGWRSPATPAAWPGGCSSPNTPTTRRATVARGAARAVTALPLCRTDGAT